MIVVDDASMDGTVERLRGAFGSRIKLFAKRSRTGQARTANIAMCRSRGELVKFLPYSELVQ